MRIKITLAIVALACLSGQVLSGPKVWTVPAAKIKGQPPFEDGKQVALFIWQDAAGFHVRWTTADKPTLFSGRIDLDKPLKAVKRIDALGSGYLKQHGDRIIMWSATTRGPSDGFDLVVPTGRRLQMELSIDGQAPTVEQVFFGEKKFNPPGFPLLINLR